MTSLGKLCIANRGTGTKRRMRDRRAVGSVGETLGDYFARADAEVSLC